MPTSRCPRSASLSSSARTRRRSGTSSQDLRPPCPGPLGWRAARNAAWLEDHHPHERRQTTAYDWPSSRSYRNNLVVAAPGLFGLHNYPSRSCRPPRACTPTPRFAGTDLSVQVEFATSDALGPRYLCVRHRLARPPGAQRSSSTSKDTAAQTHASLCPRSSTSLSAVPV